ncbi:MAG: hypothetical protein LBO20_00245 [Bifidobacteriaceae bacterium]|nr:hypothetical protein [Bifidobacteriaceae bacterium]
MAQRLAAQAEEGFPGVRFTRPKTGRPWLAAQGPARQRTVRLPQGLDAALAARAEHDNATPSQVIRQVLSAYLVSG